MLRAGGIVNGWIVHGTAGPLVIDPVVDDLHQRDRCVILSKNTDSQVGVNLWNGSANMEGTVSEEDPNVVPLAVDHLLGQLHHPLPPLPGKAAGCVLSQCRVVGTEMDDRVGFARHNHEGSFDVRPEH